MKTLEVGVLPVSTGDRLVGMLTDRDIALRVVAEDHDPATTPVCQVMTPESVSCFEDQDVTEAARVMEERRIRRLPVLNRQHQLVGLVSLDDVATRTGDPELAGEVLRHAAETAHSRRSESGKD
jgi:CBS domain-containing protein